MSTPMRMHGGDIHVYRSANLEHRVVKKRQELHERAERLAAERAAVLQAEAELVEATKTAEVNSRLVHDRERQMEARLGALVVLEREADDARQAVQRQHDADIESHDSLQASIEARWKALEETLSAHETQTLEEKARLSGQLSDVAAREAVLREKQRFLAEREAACATRLRAIDNKQVTLRNLRRVVIEQRRQELSQREALLKE